MINTSDGYGITEDREPPHGQQVYVVFNDEFFQFYFLTFVIFYYQIKILKLFLKAGSFLKANSLRVFHSLKF
jgi:hypothetical protein